MNQNRRSFIKITSLASASFLPLSKILAQGLSEDEEIKRRVDESFNQDYQFHLIDNNLLNLHFYFLNAERKGDDLRQISSGKRSFMIVRLPQMHVSEKGFWDEDWADPVKRFPDAKLSGFSYLAFQLWPDYKDQEKKPKKKKMEFTLHNILNWNDQRNFDLITLTEWFELKNDGKSKGQDRWDLIFRNYEEIRPGDPADKNKEFEDYKLWHKNEIEVNAEFETRGTYYIKTTHEPKHSFDYKKYSSIILNFLDKNYNAKDTGNDFIPITFLEAPANLCLVPMLRKDNGMLATASDYIQKKFWQNKMVKRYNTVAGRNKYEVWLNTLFFATKTLDQDSAKDEEKFIYKTPSFRIVGLISDTFLQIKKAAECLTDCKTQAPYFLPSLLNKTELTFLTQYAKEQGKRDYSQEAFDIKEINGLFFTGLGIITHLKYYNVDHCPVEKGIDLIEYEHRVTEGRDLFVKVARLGYNSKTGQRYKHVIEAKRKIDLVDNQPTSYQELKQYCECIDHHIIYNEKEAADTAWPTNFNGVTTDVANCIINPAKSNTIDFKRNVFISLTVTENKRIPIRCLTASGVEEQDVCKIQCLEWFWPVMERATKTGDKAVDIPYASYLMCEYNAKDWENTTINARTPFIFLRASYIERNQFKDVYNDYFAGDYYLRLKLTNRLDDHNLIERRKTYFGNQKIAYTPSPSQKLPEYLKHYDDKLRAFQSNDSHYKLTKEIADDLRSDIENVDRSKSKSNILETDFIESYFQVKKKSAFGNQMTATKYVVFPQLLRSNVYVDHIRDLTQQKISSVVEYQKDYIAHEFRSVSEVDGTYANGAKVILSNTEAFNKQKEEEACNTYSLISKALQEAKAKIGNLAVPDIIPDSISLEKFGITLPRDIADSIAKGRTVLANDKGLEKIAKFNPIELLRGKMSDVCGLDLTRVLDELLPAVASDNQTPLFEINKLLNQLKGEVLSSPIYQQLINLQVKDPIDGQTMTIPALVNKYEGVIYKTKNEIERNRLLLNQSIKELSQYIPNADELDNLVKSLVERYRTAAYAFITSVAEVQDIENMLNQVKEKALQFCETEKYLLIDELEEKKKAIGNFFVDVQKELNLLPATLRQIGTAKLEDLVTQGLNGFYQQPDLLDLDKKVKYLFKAIPENVAVQVDGKQLYFKVDGDQITWELTIDAKDARPLLVFDANNSSYIQLEKKVSDLKKLIAKNINGNVLQRKATAVLAKYISDSKAKLETLEKEVNSYQAKLGLFLLQLDRWKLEAQRYLQNTLAVPPATQDILVKVMAVVARANAYIDFLRKFDPYFYYAEQQRLFKEVKDLEGRFRKDWVRVENTLHIKEGIETAVKIYKDKEAIYAAAIRNFRVPVPGGEVVTQAQLNALREQYIKMRTDFTDAVNKKSEEIINEIIREGDARLKDLYGEVDRLKKAFSEEEEKLKNYLNYYKHILDQQANDLRKGFDQKLREFIDAQEAKLRDSIGNENIQAVENEIAEAKNIYRLITSIKQQELSYNWKTTSFKDVNLGMVAFKKFSNPSTSLKVNVKAITYFSQGLFPPTIEKIVTYSENSFSNFGITFFNCLGINFNEISFSSGSDRQTHFDVKIKDVKFEGALSFVQSFQSYLQTLGKGFILSLQGDHVALGYSLPIPTIKTPGFSFFNLSLNFDLRVYFDNRPLLFAFSLARPESKFGIAAGIYAGFGFFSIAADPKRGVVEIDCALEAGVWSGIKIGPIKGEVKLAFGFRYTKNNFGVRLEGYIVAEGRLSVWIIDVSARIYLGVTSVNSYVEGRCTVTYSARLGLVSKSFSGTFAKSIAGAKKENSEAQKKVVGDYFEALDKRYKLGVFQDDDGIDTASATRHKSNKEMLKTYLDELDQEEEIESYHVSAKEWDDFINAY